MERGRKRGGRTDNDYAIVVGLLVGTKKSTFPGCLNL